MNLEIRETTKNGLIEIANYESIIAEAEEIVKPYRTLVVDARNIDECKEFKTKLNAIIKTINDSRIASQKKYMIPFNYGKNQYDNIIKVFQETADNLKGQLDQVEEAYRIEKREKIEQIYKEVFNTNLIPIENIYNSKWDNHTYKIETIKKELAEQKEKIDNEISVMKSITKGEDLYALLYEYFQDLEMAKAIEKLKNRKYTIEIIKNEIEKEGK